MGNGVKRIFVFSRREIAQGEWNYLIFVNTVYHVIDHFRDWYLIFLCSMQVKKSHTITNFLQRKTVKSGSNVCVDIPNVGVS